MSREEIEKFAEEKGISYLECSAKDYKSVERCFMKLAEKILEKIENKEISPLNEVI